MNDALKRIKKLAKNDYAFMLDDENNPYAVSGHIDTGCYVLNAVMGNGDIYSGLPIGKRVCVAGPSSTAKSFFVAHVVKSFLDEDKDNNVIFFESEGSSISEMADNLGIDKSRVIILPVTTVEEFRTQVVNVLDGILEEQKEKKEKVNKSKYLVCLDSIGMLGSQKEYQDAVDDKQTVDMTRAKAVKSVFRLITLKLSLAKTSLIVVAHTYDTMEMFSKKKVSGGTGLDYAADVTLILTKAKQKEGTEHIGANITCNVEKSRYIPEGTKVKVQILFKKGLSKYSSLVEMAYEYGVFKKEGISFILPDGDKVKMKEVRENPDKYIPKYLEEIRKEILNRFSYNTESEVEYKEEEEQLGHENENEVDQLEENNSTPKVLNED